MSFESHHRGSHRAAFSLVESVGAVLLCGTLAVFGLPYWVRQSERGRVAEAFEYLQHISQLQQQHFDELGCFELDPMSLDLALVVPSSFVVETDPVDSPDPSTNWCLSLVRQGSYYGYGDYQISFDATGFMPNRSTVCQTLVPAIHSSTPHRDSHSK